MTLSRIDLEKFEEFTAEAEDSPDYVRGFEDGEKTAQNAEAKKLTAAIESISAALSDMTFGYTEARIQLLERIRPLMAQVAETVLPSITMGTFSAHLVDVIARDFEKAMSHPLQISVPPDAIDQLTQLLSDHEGDFTFVSDPMLEPGQAILKDTHTHIIVDLPALMLALQTALHGLETLERSISNG